ncbi:hypothetical protein UPYG_G00039550 [Umbra pygmaea]|uniref:Uncharacterized protein n=1 Tax=Umbra pygmaea TaxID=75934 RepID=A0ABD0Y8E2_UMBPY
MACSPNLNETLPHPEEIEFNKVLIQIGGKEKIYLVSDDVKSNRLEEDSDILQELIQDMFPSGDNENIDLSPDNNCNRPIYSSTRNQEDTVSENNVTRETVIDCINLPQTQGNEILVSPKPKDLRLGAKPVGEDEGPPRVNGKVPRTKTSSMNICGRKRIIDSPMIIFVFRHEFFNGSANAICLKEILKDVRARTKRASVRPALIGLVRSKCESNKTHDSVGDLECLLRSVFREHPPEAIWVGHFIPKTKDRMLAIKRYACQAIYSSKSSDSSGNRVNTFLGPFQCLPLLRRGHRDQGNNTSAGSQRGDLGSAEEGISLKTCISVSGDLIESDHCLAIKDCHEPHGS